MELTLVNVDATRLRAGYECPCGCTPAVVYERESAVAEEGCCCGNQFAVGPDAAATLTPKPGFRSEREVFEAPWGQALEAAWLVGPSVHGPATEHAHEHEEAGHTHGHHDAAVIDPVCGMTVDPETALGSGLHSSHEGVDYFFCGKGCLLEFRDDPRKYLDPSYAPSM